MADQKKVETSKLFGSFNRCFTELFHELRNFQSSFACTGTGSFVTFYNLKVSVGLENFNLSIDLFY